MKLKTKFSNVESIRVVDTDLVINLREGGREVVPDGALRAMADPKFTLEFEDQTLTGDQLLKSVGNIEVEDAARLSASSVTGGAMDASLAGSAGAFTPSASSAAGGQGFLYKWQSLIGGGVAAVGAGVAVGSMGGGNDGGQEPAPTTGPSEASIPPRMDISLNALDGYSFNEALNGASVAEIFADKGTQVAVTLRVGSSTTTVIVTGNGSEPVSVVFPGNAFADANGATRGALVAQVMPSGERFGNVALSLDLTPPAAGDHVLAIAAEPTALTYAHLGLQPNDLLRYVGSTVSLSGAENGSVRVNGEPVTEFSFNDLLAGKVSFEHAQAETMASGPGAAMAWELHLVGSVAPTLAGALDLASPGNGAVIWGDGSGRGGSASQYTLPYNQATTAGADGGGGDDLLVGTRGADLIFGDGSGGGGGGGWIAGAAGGKGGGGNDRIFAGDGDDIVFGDGFDGTTAGTRYGAAGGYGGGGGGLGQSGGGANGWGGSAGGAANAWGTAGTGASNGAGGNYVADRDGNGGDIGQFTTGTVASAVAQARSEFLAGPSSGSNMFKQGMGRGNDAIDGGSGADYIMGGGGNDSIRGGQGNDIMYGGSGVGKQAGESNTFVWKQGDAGTGAMDIIRDFSVWNGSEGDRLDVSKLLQGFRPGTDDISHWITTAVTTAPEAQGWDAGRQGLMLTIDVDGDGSGRAMQQIFLSNITDAHLDAAALVASGALIV
ncbi:MAG: type I secretion C-terminal target domain-containing protein [Candidatus Dactylopiibacterium sp.]|nr:type I secretion C-terminal target domain-containing protein [Candidatus Dactylopiibacterium sp.]